MRQSILSPDSSGHPEGGPAWAKQWAPRVPPRTLFIIAQTPSLACQPRPACSLGRYWGGESFRSDESHRNQLRELMKRTKKRVCLTAGWQARLDLSSSRGDGDKDRVIPRGAPCPHYGGPHTSLLAWKMCQSPHQSTLEAQATSNTAQESPVWRNGERGKWKGGCLNSCLDWSFGTQPSR